MLPYFTLFGLAWAGTESLLFHAKLRRRLSLGLADAVTTDRLRLWAIAMLSAFAITTTSLILRQLGVPMTPMLSAVVVGPLGLLAATAMWLAFLSPLRYRSWGRGAHRGRPNLTERHAFPPRRSWARA